MQLHFLGCVLLILLIAECGAHECYVCHEQDSNRGKCTETVEPCDFEQDHCLSEIKWGSTPFWEVGAPMQYYISKKCATRQDCTDTISGYLPYCDYINWKDWKCAECCKGDRCNFFVTLGASSLQTTSFGCTIAVLVVLLWYAHR
ncbi:uncharacterized protein LOC108671037 [Hyalella azteca]|uniref:Uncharacterized protein LOC108671037 n=1 Tax=Hyalella azteca TaxID=294128 RepID=A0A8B7NK29_HYAAZ|nr:uncharacterized protein LOC108671037 [Hyalella azteca]